MAHIEPTVEQLQAAFEQMRRPDWPRHLADALQRPLCAALIRGQAVRNALRPTRAPHAAPARRPPITHVPPLRPPAGIDRKRAAAGDRDDD